MRRPLYPQCVGAAASALLLAGAASATPRAGAVKRALVIAVGDYHTPWEHLENPPHDLEDMTRKMKGLGFDVTSKLNPTKRQMIDAVHDLVDDLRPGDMALFYFSGHGVQVNGENYLIPKGFDSAYEADVDDGTFHVKLLKDNLETREGVVSVIILDACRTDGLIRGHRGAGERGLTAMPDLPQGMVVAFASAANQPAQEGTGRNGVYTAALLKHIDTPGARIDDLLRDVAREVYVSTNHAQLPALYGTLLDPVCLAGSACGSGQPAAAEAPAAVAPPATQAPGRLKIVSEPSGAEVSIDGEAAGTTPLKKQVDPGTYHVRLALSGYPAVEKDIVVESGRETYDMETLTKTESPAAPARPAVALRSKPPSESTFRAANLTWQMEPSPRKRNWNDSKAYCLQLALAGGGWRLPSKDELRALYAAKKSSPAISSFAHMNDWWYWSATPTGGGAWGVIFSYGDTGDDIHVGFTGHVRCVR